MKTLILFFSLLSITIGPSDAAVDCGKTTKIVDKLVCFNSRASEAEERMAYAFHLALQRGVSPKLLRETQKNWKKNVRDLCKSVSCLVDASEIRITELYELM